MVEIKRLPQKLLLASVSQQSQQNWLGKHCEYPNHVFEAVNQYGSLAVMRDGLLQSAQKSICYCTLFVRTIIAAVYVKASDINGYCQGVFNRIEALGLLDHEREILHREWLNPSTPRAIGKLVRCTNSAFWVYALSCLVIGSDSPRSAKYLKELGAELDLSKEAKQKAQLIAGKVLASQDALTAA